MKNSKSLFEELNKIFDSETQSKKYKEIIIKYFYDLIEYIKNKEIQSKTNKKNIDNDNNVNGALFYIDKINVNDDFSFVNEKYKKYKNTIIYCPNS